VSRHHDLVQGEEVGTSGNTALRAFGYLALAAVGGLIAWFSSDGGAGSEIGLAVGGFMV
jgi:hypothetical protein